MSDRGYNSLIKLKRLKKKKKTLTAMYPCRLTGKMPERVHSMEENPCASLDRLIGVNYILSKQ